MEKKKRNLDWVGKKRDFQYSGETILHKLHSERKIRKFI